MSTILDQPRVLVLNKNFVAINILTPREAFLMMASDAATALNTDNDCFVPTKWADWILLDVREGDDSIKTARKAVRIPRVIVAVNYTKIVAKKPRLTMQKLRERDGNKCAYTGAELSSKECSMEHVVPKSKGGKKEWNNIVLAHRDVNSQRGNRSLEEAGLKLRVQPTAPKELPFHERVENTFGYPEWDAVLPKKKRK